MSNISDDWIYVNQKEANAMICSGDFVGERSRMLGGEERGYWECYDGLDTHREPFYYRVIKRAQVTEMTEKEAADKRLRDLTDAILYR